MTADATRPENLGKVDELWRYEEERDLRRRRFNRFSMRIVALVMIAALGMLSYDAGQAALALRRNKPLAVAHYNKLASAADIHGSWVYPAVISGVSGLAALVILIMALRRGRRGGAHRNGQNHLTIRATRRSFGTVP